MLEDTEKDKEKNKEEEKIEKEKFPSLAPWKIDNGNQMIFFYSKQAPELHFSHSGLDISKITAEFSWKPPTNQELAEGFKDLKSSNETMSVDVMSGQICSDLLSKPLTTQHFQVPIPMPHGERQWNAFNFHRFDSKQFTVAVVPVLPQNITQ